MASGREEALRTTISTQPWNTAAWDGLLSIVASTGSADKQREIYEELLAQYPYAALYWQRYAELELDDPDPQRAKLVFSRCLLNCPSVKLWSLYLRFIRKMNEPKGTAGLTELRKSYEYTLERVGTDSGAGGLWQEYISFLQSPRTGSPAYQALFASQMPGQEEAQRVLWLRRAYHKALTVPGKHLDPLWRAYEDFERSCSNAQLARREVDEQRPRYQAAKAAAPDRARLQQNLMIYNLAVPPGMGGAPQLEQARLWKEYIGWEKSNPQRLDALALSQRVSLAYEQSLMPLTHFPEIWYSHSRWHAVGGGGGPAAAVAVLGKARIVLPDCLMLLFAAAELEESRGEIETARGLYEEKVQSLPPAPEASTSGKEEGAAPEGISQEERDAGTLVWTQYLCFSRRVDGVQASRKIFLRARKWHGCSWQVFVAAAQLEYASEGNDRVARNIYELGLEHFIAIPKFVLQYAEFLIGLADIHNARALFERALGAVPTADSKPIWDRFIEFQCKFGDLAATAQLEERRREALGPSSTDDVNVLVLKYRFLDLWPCTDPQKDHLRRLFGELPSATPAAQPSALQASIPNSSPQADDLLGPAHLVTDKLGAQSGPPRIEPIKQMPPELGKFLALLPSARTLEHPHASVEAVVDVLMKADLSPAGIAAAEDAAAAVARALRGGPVTLPQPTMAPLPGSLQHQNGGMQHPQQQFGGRPGGASHGTQGWEAGKRGREEGLEAGEIAESSDAVDPYRARVKQRIKKAI